MKNKVKNKTQQQSENAAKTAKQMDKVEELAGLGWLGLRKAESVLGSAIDGLFGWIDKGINTAWTGIRELLERGINWIQGKGFRTGLEIATQAALQALHRMGVEEATNAAVAEFGRQQMQGVLNSFYKDSRETTDAKINALKQAGYDTTELEAEIQKRRQAIEEAKRLKAEQLDKTNIEEVQVKEAGIVSNLLKILFGKEDEKIIKGVKYHSQRDNETKDGKVNGHNMCQLTSLAMIMEYKGIEIGNGDKQYEDKLYEIAKRIGKGDNKLWDQTEDVYKEIINYINKINNENNLIVVISNLRKIDFESNVKKLIDQGKPVIASGNFPNGHVIVIVGYDKKGWIAHDPYGDANTKYKNTNGMYVRYKYGDFSIGKKWFAYIK